MRLLSFFIFFALTASVAKAHYLWIETSPQAKLASSHAVKVFFGEYTHGAIEAVEGEAFSSVDQFKLFLVAPDGTKSELKVTKADNHYLASFTPKTTGTYHVVLDNDNIDVIDYMQYDFGIFKTHYHASAEVVVGDIDRKSDAFNKNGLSIILIDGTIAKGEQLTLQLLYKGQPLTNHEVAIYMADLWSKELKTDEDGKFQLTLPWAEKYIIEATYNEEESGTYKGEAYEFIWHCVTRAFLTDKQGV